MAFAERGDHGTFDFGGVRVGCLAPRDEQIGVIDELPDATSA